MKDNELHYGLEHKEVRNALAKMLVNAGQLNVDWTFNNQKGWDASIDFAKHQIKYFQNEVEKYEIYKAVETISKLYGWIEHDLSDYVEKTGKLYISFFGTQEEFIDLCTTHGFDIEL